MIISPSLVFEHEYTIQIRIDQFFFEETSVYIQRVDSVSVCGGLCDVLHPPGTRAQRKRSKGTVENGHPTTHCEVSHIFTCLLHERLVIWCSIMLSVISRHLVVVFFLAVKLIEFLLC